MAAPFNLPVASDVPEDVRAAPTEDEWARAISQLGVSREEVKPLLLAAVPDFPMGWAYQKWYRDLDPEQSADSPAHGVAVLPAEDFNAMWGPGAVARALRSLLQHGRPVFFFRSFTVSSEHEMH